MSIMAVCPCGLKFETEERDLVEINRLLRADGWVFGRDGVWRCRETIERRIKAEAAKLHRQSEKRAKKLANNSS